MNIKIKRILTSVMALSLIGSVSYVPAKVGFDSTVASAAVTTYTYEDDWSTITYTISSGYALVSNVTPKNGVSTVYVPTTLSNYQVKLGYKCFDSINQTLNVNCSSVAEVNAYAFYNCTGIKEIHLNTICTKVNAYAFYNCTGIERAIFGGFQYADLNNGTKLTLESRAFYNCTNLNYISFGCRDNIIVKNNAFYGSPNLSEFYMFNASSDHSSFYANEGAFNGTGIINNTNSVKSATTMAASNGRYNIGDAKKLTGNTAVVTLFVNASNSSAFTTSQKNSYNANVVRCMSELESEAAKYSKTLSMQHLPITVNSTSTLSAIESNGNFTDDSQVLSACKSAYSFLSGCTSMSGVTQAIKSQYGVENVAYMVVLNTTGGDYAYSFKTAREYAVIHSQGAYSYNDDYVWMHELLHLFGAMDLYDGRVQNSGYTRQFLSYDIMYHNLSASVGWFTACNIGWTDTVLADDFKNIIKTDGSAVTVDYD